MSEFSRHGDGDDARCSRCGGDAPGARWREPILRQGIPDALCERSPLVYNELRVFLAAGPISGFACPSSSTARKRATGRWTPYFDRKGANRLWGPCWSVVSVWAGRRLMGSALSSQVVQPSPTPATILTSRVTSRSIHARWGNLSSLQSWGRCGGRQPAGSPELGNNSEREYFPKFRPRPLWL